MEEEIKGTVHCVDCGVLVKSLSQTRLYCYECRHKRIAARWKIGKVNKKK